MDEDIDVEIAQDVWDEIVSSWFFKGTVGSSLKEYLSFIGVSYEEHGGYCGTIELLTNMGVLRLPRITQIHADEERVWWNTYQKLPLTAWLARASHGSIDILLSKNEHERKVLFSAMKTKILRPKNSLSRRDRIRRGANNVGGMPVTIQLRSLDQKHGWGTVK
jgi:hypothetical protein